MSTNELRAGRRPTHLVWPDDRVTVASEDGCTHMQMVEVPGELGNVSMVRAHFDDGTTAIINPRHVAMICFDD